ncbi:MAG TPA: primosomal protein N', partial [Polyangiaceae bacterium]|nr:primosomal protein N' [Polyangiaceae bacterium]
MDALELFATPPAAPSGPLVRVALPVPLGRAFTYAAGPHADVAPGARVLVEFGRRKCIGVVIERDAPTPPDLDPSKLKTLLGVLDREPALSPELLGFCLALGRYYLAPIGEVLRLALPALERSLAGELENLSGKKFKAVGRLVQVVEALPSEASIESLAPSLGRGSGAELLTALRQEGPLEVARASERFRGARSAMKKLVELGLARMDKRAQTVDPFFAEALVRDEPPRLNDGQTRAVESLTRALTTGGGAFLLDGVTASGKTEVYLHVAEQALRSGRGVLLLVPEIALTPQLVGRFRARLGDAIAVLHSELSETARLEMWKSLKSGERRVVVGARSALFAPLRDLALICVDEEHDPSYKQEEGVRYNARDMALVRAKRAGAVCVLGSATPSLTSELAVREGKLTRLVLSERARQAARLPQVELIDLKRFGPGPSGDPLLSLPLHRALEDNLAAGGQSILFLNRRGFAPSLVCEGCGEIRRCPNCSVPLTLHRVRGARLECHYCDHHEALGPSCPACGSPRWVEEGAGTERIETLLKQHFPTARVGRLDRDVARGQRGERVIESMRRGELDILIGTQMVTK